MTAEDRMASAWRKILYVLVIAIALVTFLTVYAFAHDHNRPGLDDWYMNLRSGKGPCCGGPSIDATTLAEPDWEAKDGHYRVRIDGKWIDVPDEAVMKEPNLDGRTLVWPMWSDGERTIRCFMPGAMI